MEIGELNKVLKEQAVNLNACYKGVSKMDKELNIEELIGLWKHHIDFAIDKGFPTLDFIKSNMDKETLNNNGVWVDEDVVAIDRNGILVLNGKCTGSVMQSGFTAVSVYLRHECDVEIVVKGFSKVFVHCYDDAKCHIKQSEMGKCFVYMHDNSTETHEGEVNIRKK